MAALTEKLSEVLYYSYNEATFLLLGFGMKGVISLLCSPTTHTAGNVHEGMLTDTKFKYIQTKNMHTISKAARDICYSVDQRQPR